MRFWQSNGTEPAERGCLRMQSEMKIARGTEFVIYSPSVSGSETNSWGLATYAFFSVVYQQLPDNGPRFYAINGGNDLGGMFLTADEVAHARAAFKTREDWPYLPTKQAPWFGQEH
jgi:hypothetical protein